MYPHSDRSAHPTRVRCEYQPATDTVFVYSDGQGGIKTLEVPAADVARALAEKPYVT